MIKDLVSVIIPCYNGAKYVEEALDSIIKQTYKFLEIIVIDDNSTDNTFDLLERIAKKDDRIRLFRNESNLKLINTLNRGIDLSNGEYIARMDQDDIAHSGRIETEYNFLRNENFDVVSCGIKFFKKK